MPLLSQSIANPPPDMNQFLPVYYNPNTGQLQYRLP